MTFDIQCPNCGTTNGLTYETRVEAKARATNLEGYTCNACGTVVNPTVVQSTDQ